ncbi:recombinase family protein [Streptomyces sp. CB00316]|uniref:recombinase family protein n=1 Tax=Streptomyces sp. CB00316 TaxID=1703932 RepID=UPI00093C68EC|nr:recombinase family protein [Streptomyces sp. CB00316]
MHPFGSGDALREAVDLDVSASTFGPFDRPELGGWLNRPDEYDALVWWRFDRAIRSMAHMHELAKWARDHRKMLVFAEGIGGGKLVFDFRNPVDPMAEFQMMMLAFAAQVESQSIKDRVTGAMAAIRRMPLRWRGGGRPPYGYMPAPMAAEFGGIGWTLVPDPDAVKVIERIVRELLEGTTVSAIHVVEIPGYDPEPELRPQHRQQGTHGHGRALVLLELRQRGMRPVGVTMRCGSTFSAASREGRPVRDAEGVRRRVGREGHGGATRDAH